MAEDKNEMVDDDCEQHEFGIFVVSHHDGNLTARVMCRSCRRVVDVERYLGTATTRVIGVLAADQQLVIHAIDKNVGLVITVELE